ITKFLVEPTPPAINNKNCRLIAGQREFCLLFLQPWAEDMLDQLNRCGMVRPMSVGAGKMTKFLVHVGIIQYKTCCSLHVVLILSQSFNYGFTIKLFPFPHQ